jgi:acetyltransferase-like isoleucine patch superfamily enzyme
MKKLRKIIRTYLLKYFIDKKAKKKFQSYPFAITLGFNAFFDEATKVDGGKYIKIGRYSSIGHNSWLGAFDSYLNQKYIPKITIGENVRIGNYACITSIDEIIIKNGCLISEHVYISDHFHGFDPSLNLSPAKQPLFSKGKVIIGENSFVGYRVTILSGVELGNNCVVGAHSVVTKSFPPYSMLAGAPAKLIKKYNFEKKSWERG